MKSRTLILVAILSVIAGIIYFALPASQGGNPAGDKGLGEGLLVVQIALLLLVGRGLGEIMQRFGQPAVIGQLLAGLILGPSLFGWVWPEAHQLIFPKNQQGLKGIADVGVLMLLLLTGMEIDLKLVRKVGMPAIAITLAGICVPFPMGFALGEFMPQSLMPASDHRLVQGLFLGTALSISSIKVVAMVVREMNFMRRDLGQIIVSSAIMEDTIGWVIIAMTLGIAGSGGIAFGPLGKTLIGTAVFLGVSFTIGRVLVFNLIRVVNDHFVSEYAVVTTILIVMLAMALITQLLGINTVLGAFVAGVLVGESPLLSGHIQDQLRGFITAFLMPIFFGLSGLSADLTVLKDPMLAELTIGLVAIASLGKFAGAFAGGRLSGLSGAQALAVGCGMNARGSTEVIVATIGLSMGALTQNLYTMIVVMAVVTTMAMPPMLRWALSRLPLEKDEENRLAQEEIDAKGFLSNAERLLIAADGSANGELASRVAGAIGGRHGLLVTVVDLHAANAGESLLAAVVEVSAKESAQTTSRKHDMPRTAEITTRVETGDSAQAVAEEAEKGFDMLFIGLEKMVTAQGGFTDEINRIAAEFEGPIALVLAGADREADWFGRPNIVIPVDGTPASRSGAEIAFSLAPNARGTALTAVHTSERATSPGKPRIRRNGTPRGAEKATLDDVKALGERYGFRVGTASHLRVAPEKAILTEAGRVKADLLVIGANRRVGEGLFLGEVAVALMKQWPGGLVLVAV